MAAARRRRKKKASESMERYKQPLVFAESPIEGSRHYCTPVQAARNPYLAPSIAVDDLDLKWVSPQFLHGTTSQDLTFCQTKKCRNNKKSNKENTNSKRITERLVIPPLDFGQETKSSQKIQKCLRRSTRLKEKLNQGHEHFLFQDIKDTHQPVHVTCNVLAPDTPHQHCFPALLHNRKTRASRSSALSIEQNVCETP